MPSKFNALLLVFVLANTYHSGSARGETGQKNNQSNDSLKSQEKESKVARRRALKKYRKDRGFRYSGYYLSVGPYKGSHEPVGMELSLLYKYVGLSMGQNSDRRYGEIEYANGISLGAGMAQYNDTKDQAAQWTIGLPVFFLFPYARFIEKSKGRDAQRSFGMMAKFCYPFEGCGGGSLNRNWVGH